MLAAVILAVTLLPAADNAYELSMLSSGYAVAEKDEGVREIAGPASGDMAQPDAKPSPTPEPTLEYGQESAKVQALQERLMDLGFLGIDEPTEYFGPATRQAVTIFQRQHSLEQSGVANPETLALIYSDDALIYTIREGMQGSDIDSIQRQLISLGYLNKATGYYGTESIAAVKTFQERNGLSPDGVIGPVTLDLLYSPEAKVSVSKAREERRRANIKKVVETAKKQVGKPYILGNEGPKSFDCSGLVYYCLREAGSNRSRYNAAGYSRVTDWDKIEFMGDLQIGDLLFFYDNGYNYIGHVGIYIGSGYMVDASASRGKVVKRSCRTTYWKKHWAWGRRPW